MDLINLDFPLLTSLNNNNSNNNCILIEEPNLSNNIFNCEFSSLNNIEPLTEIDTGQDLLIINTNDEIGNEFITNLVINNEITELFVQNVFVSNDPVIPSELILDSCLENECDSVQIDNCNLNVGLCVDSAIGLDGLEENPQLQNILIDDQTDNNIEQSEGVIQEKPFSVFCACCNVLFTNEAEFNTHKKISSVLDKPYQCQICLKSFTQQSNLWKHTRTHTGKKPFQCPHCSKTFSQRANMLKHSIIHTGQRPFSCQACCKTFTQEANLNKHFLTHTGDKPFKCEVCFKSFNQRSNLITHQLLHESKRPFSCDTCSATFTQKGNLNKHIMLMHQQSFHSCKFCLKTYTHRARVDKHMNNCPVRTLCNKYELNVTNE